MINELTTRSQSFGWFLFYRILAPLKHMQIPTAKTTVIFYNNLKNRVDVLFFQCDLVTVILNLYDIIKQNL